MNHLEAVLNDATIVVPSKVSYCAEHKTLFQQALPRDTTHSATDRQVAKALAVLHFR